MIAIIWILVKKDYRLCIEYFLYLYKTTHIIVPDVALTVLAEAW